LNVSNGFITGIEKDNQVMDIHNKTEAERLLSFFNNEFSVHEKNLPSSVKNELNSLYENNLTLVVLLNRIEELKIQQKLTKQQEEKRAILEKIKKLQQFIPQVYHDDSIPSSSASSKKEGWFSKFFGPKKQQKPVGQQPPVGQQKQAGQQPPAGQQKQQPPVGQQKQAGQQPPAGQQKQQPPAGQQKPQSPLVGQPPKLLPLRLKKKVSMLTQTLNAAQLQKQIENLTNKIKQQQQKLKQTVNQQDKSNINQEIQKLKKQLNQKTQKRKQNLDKALQEAQKATAEEKKKQPLMIQGQKEQQFFDARSTQQNKQQKKQPLMIQGQKEQQFFDARSTQQE
jgi:MFS superfamily sulfate permease-like transporter